jgi:hypothetical protein
LYAALLLPELGMISVLLQKRIIPRYEADLFRAVLKRFREKCWITNCGISRIRKWCSASSKEIFHSGDQRNAATAT